MNRASFVRALEKSLSLHADWKDGKLKLPPPPDPVPARSLPVVADVVAKKKCVHCHQVAAGQALNLFARPDFDRKRDVWVYPDPASLGLGLDPQTGNTLLEAEGAAEAAGLRAGDEITTVDGHPVHTFADIQYRLHRLGQETRSVALQSGTGREHTLRLPDLWRITNIERRPISHRLEPFPGFWGKPVEDAERENLGLAAEGIATRITKFWRPTNGKRAGLREGDIITSVNGVSSSPLTRHAMIHIRLHHKTGEKITLEFLRNGKSGEATYPLKARPWG